MAKKANKISELVDRMDEKVAPNIKASVLDVLETYRTVAEGLKVIHPTAEAGIPVEIISHLSVVCIEKAMQEEAIIENFLKENIIQEDDEEEEDSEDDEQEETN